MYTRAEESLGGKQILYYTRLYYNILYYYTLLYSNRTLLYYTILYYTRLYYTILYYTIYYTVWNTLGVAGREADPATRHGAAQHGLLPRPGRRIDYYDYC